ncbi:4-hydroxy-3-methylbut-2-enyl diphosphate reductase [Hyphococcus flavus]|uniref:4-hydroxy-3-methylbut-2-enyl diphosphate reductase n=1 Tax=Hyphococcus flavus TaxID=1866326 RepID=A0AAE9ZBW1_9PROT|nr:4-hydroxy-3-methylbut-2-enyl diphosphate reductase [Hyphococcus flavus]WDI31411.1 4-hydroxy-3-methylbut-2-enyl diphosphate reductase [Hyphococcus flavus]
MTAPRPQATDDLSILTVRLASPRGFCAGVERAIRTVEDTLSQYGRPVFVRHEIVHNVHVVSRLAAMGAVFVESLDEVPSDRPVVFSAHGAPISAHQKADSRHLVKIDATCPLVLKVHNQTRRHIAAGRHVILIGHAGHPEVIGTMGQAPDGGSITLIETEDEASKVSLPDAPLAYVTQTTLSVDETRGIIDVLKSRFPDIAGPAKEDICYATSNRQAAVKATAPGTDLFVVIGSETSSNSVRLVETALAAGSAKAVLTDGADSFDWSLCDAARSIGVSAGASAPEELVEAFLTTLAKKRPIKIESVETAKENIVFKPALRLAS